MLSRKFCCRNNERTDNFYGGLGGWAGFDINDSHETVESLIYFMKKCFRCETKETYFIFHWCGVFVFGQTWLSLRKNPNNSKWLRSTFLKWILKWIKQTLVWYSKCITKILLLQELLNIFLQNFSLKKILNYSLIYDMQFANKYLLINWSKYSCSKIFHVRKILQ